MWTSFVNAKKRKNSDQCKTWLSLTCQSHRAWEQPSLDPAADSGVWCPDGRYQTSECRPGSWRAGTYTTTQENTHTQIHTQRLEKQQTSITALKYRNSGLYFSSREWVLQQMFRLQFHTLFLLTPKHCHSAFVEIKLSIWSVFIDTHVLKWKQIFKSKLISCFKFATSGQSILTNKIKKCFTC